MLGYVKKQADSKKVSSAFVDLFSSLENTAGRLLGVAPVDEIVSGYMKAGGKLATTASRIAVSQSARAYILEAHC